MEAEIRIFFRPKERLESTPNLEYYCDINGENMATIQPAVVGFSWATAVDLSRKESRTRLSPAAIKGIFRIADRWRLRDEDTRALLGGMSSGSFYALKGRANKTLDEDQLTRVSLLIGVFKALNILYSQKLADSWISLPNANPMFGGDSPLNYMKKGGIPAIIRIRQLLDARRGGR
jgi:Protein of unknown function (DUF2384)